MKTQYIFTIISFFLLSFDKDKNTCVQKLFMGYNIDNSSQFLFDQMNQDKNFMVYMTTREFNKEQFFYAKFLSKSDTYPLVDSIYFQIGVTPNGNKINPDKITDIIYIKVCQYYKDSTIMETEFNRLKSEICKDYDFNKQVAHVKKHKDINGNGQVLFLEKKVFPMIQFDKGVFEGKYSVEVKITAVVK